MISWSHDKCIAVRIVERKIKSAANYSWTEFTVIQTLRYVFYRDNLTAVSPSVQCSNSSGRVIIVDIYTTVEKILGKASLIAMPWNGGSEMVEKLFSKRTAVPDLLCKFVWDWSALLLDLVFFPLHWSGTTRRRISNEISESEWHLLLLFHRRPLVVGLNCLVRLVSRYGLDVPRLATMVGEHCDSIALRQWFVRCGSIPARFDISFIMLSSVVVPRGALQNKILSTAGLNFLLWPPLGLWIEMPQVVLERFHRSSFRSRDGFILRICEASLVIFCSRQGTRLTSVHFVVFNPLWSFS